MCGIAGFIHPKISGNDLESAAVLDRMCRVIAHRGPDDQGMALQQGVALGMRRLAIIDLSGGRQPLSNEDGQVTVVFNGEIYNYRDLYRALQERGHAFETHSDTETIVHAYEEYGTACVERFNGMFAFALWDARSASLLLARDRAGEKPLYYTTTRQGTFVFGSELKSLLEHPEVEREISPEALDAYFSLGYVPDPLCIFRNVHKLPPGHTLVFAKGRVTVRAYWDFRYQPGGEIRREEDYLEELQARLDSAVRSRLLADVPLGAFLSGGVDSSTVVALMARHASRPVKTFSIGFAEDSFNELKFARMTAERLGTEHHEFIVTPDICNLADELAWHFDEPFADSSAIPTYMVSKLAREFVTVALSGDGGDELFAGYTRYAIDRRRSGFARLPRALRKRGLQPLSHCLPHGAWGRNFLNNIALDPRERYLDSVSLFTGLNRRALYTGDFRRQLLRTGGVAALFEGYAQAVGTGEPLDQQLYLDSKTYLPGDIMTKVDRMSMAVSLEARAPFLDHDLIDFVTAIPASLKLKGLETKHILKRAVRGLVPDEILYRPKQGFGVPIQPWINQELRDRIHGTLTESQRGYVEPRYVNLLLEEHRHQRRDHSAQLWALFMLELWHRAFLEPGRPQPSRDSASSLLRQTAGDIASRTAVGSRKGGR